jgi:hypothetical protein
MASNAKIPLHCHQGGARAGIPHIKEGILLGVGLMKALDLKLGDWVMLLTTREEGAVDGNRFQVVGVFETVMRESDKPFGEDQLGRGPRHAGGAGKICISLQAVLDETENTEGARRGRGPPFWAERIRPSRF